MHIAFMLLGDPLTGRTYFLPSVGAGIRWAPDTRLGPEIRLGPEQGWALEQGGAAYLYMGQGPGFVDPSPP